ncbi:GFA family protein [Limimaricola pyoseonensis]|uniref:Uncharacterized conserved protein n=1 Tax=Limimaricola pyoseonensis TaxID=521013 RepID=A0A1G7EX29_9RHOB|nr:hypothetical protein [Limimaricola pyoseonensis]SDE68204.1 Uncharacterized conserved protein [Limimaricola pyoseonensis]
MTMEGRCHCGATGWTSRAAPRWATECNCSICRRLGALWGHVPREGVTLHGETAQRRGYVWGDGDLEFVACATCLCVTHWQPRRGGDRMGLNLRMAPPEHLAALPVRRFDGAESWRFLDPEPGI